MRHENPLEIFPYGNSPPSSLENKANWPPSPLENPIPFVGVRDLTEGAEAWLK